MTYPPSNLFRRSYRADLALEHVVAISRFHRIQASPGYRAAAGYVADQLAVSGLEVAIRRYPADGTHSYWGQPGFLEWTCEDATLHTLDKEDRAVELLCDFDAIPTSLIQRSAAAEGEFSVVAPHGKGGTDLADYEGLDVAGGLVLTSQSVDHVYHLAVRQLGAAGILFDGMNLGERSDLDLPDARQYTSFWWTGPGQPDGWGFVLSPRQGRRLRSRLADGQAVRVRASIRSRCYAGSFEVVDALIPGKDAAGGEVLLVSHLCHPRPGAHDNGSGAAALIETASMLARLIASGSIPQPDRGIRFLWPPEMLGTYAWCAEHEAEIHAGRWVAGLNLDMVGADQCQTGSNWQFIDVPMAAPSFAGHLLSWLKEPFLAGQRHEEIAFTTGSDHFILSDPTVGVPTPMLGQWPDRFYHTSADTPDKVSPDSLGRSGALAAAYAFWLATAGRTQALWLGRWMTARFAAQTARDALELCERTDHARTVQGECTQRLAEYRRLSAFQTERMCAALQTLERLDAGLGAECIDMCAGVRELASREARWAQAQMDAEAATQPAKGEPPEASDDEADWLEEARRLVPQRIGRGPLTVGMALRARGEELLPAWWALVAQAGEGFHDTSALAEYWSDGVRSVADIAELISLETGRPANDLPLRYFKLLAQAGLVELRESS